MSTTTPQAGIPHSDAGSAGVTLPRVVRSEWTKLWSLRSTRWSLALACIFMLGLGPLAAAIEMGRWNQLSFFERATIDPVAKGVAGWNLAILAIGVLGVMTITGEYATGSIRSTLMAVPKRLPVLWSKIIVYGCVTFVLILVTGLIGYTVSQAIFSAHSLGGHPIDVPFGQDSSVRVVFGAVLFVTVTGIFCMALGAILRATAGAIATYVAVMFVIPPFMGIFPQSFQNAVDKWLPLNAGEGITKVGPQANMFSPWGGFAIFCGYTVILVAIGAYLLKKRDA
jgi:ABC-2 type transport system permease protein